MLRPRRALRSRSQPPPASAIPSTSATRSPGLGPPLGGGPWAAANAATVGLPRSDGAAVTGPALDGVAGRAVLGRLEPAELGEAEDRTPELGAGGGGVDRVAGGGAAGVAVAGTHTSSMPSDGGFGCVAPESPDPQTQASSAPSPTCVEAAPLEDQVHPRRPSPCQYPQ
jgi:hypothetical protein